MMEKRPIARFQPIKKISLDISNVLFGGINGYFYVIRKSRVRV
jgi:hypothetical protein